ncbi:Fic family protein [Desulfolutivibrio sulfodismutans DSM 3696]|nr:Fic family protein [Desulfolutivibrio sulfodismutans DSM 3696]
MPTPLSSPRPLSPILPGRDTIGVLKDMAQEVATSSAALEGGIAIETARGLGDRLRLLNSYYSNLIEGHKTTLPEIERALARDFVEAPGRRYAQELCAAHVMVERELMDELQSHPYLHVCTAEYIKGIHRRIYGHLPDAHQYTHHSGGFTDIAVSPGELRDMDVSVDGRTPHGPPASELPNLMEAFAEAFAPHVFHGDERLIAAAVSHHRLTWLHPFRDGNGRLARLHTGIYLVRGKVNQANLWSLARGFSRNKIGYMINLQATDSPGRPDNDNFFDEPLTADFCRFFFEICLDQIGFMRGLLKLDDVEHRIEWLVASLKKSTMPFLAPEASRLLRAVFRQGAVIRGKAPEIVGKSERTTRRTVISPLIESGLLVSASHRAPLCMGFPMAALPYLFPGLFDPTVVGEEYRELIV